MEGAAEMQGETTGAGGRRGWVFALAAAVVLMLAFASVAAGAPTGVIKGNVTDAVSEAGVEGVEVCALQLEETEGEPEPIFEEPACKLSGAEGAYELTGLPVGKYVVEFATPFDSSVDYVLQYFEGAALFKEAKVLDLKAGVPLTADAKMVKGGEISGRVSEASGGAPLPGALVCAFPVALGVESFGCAPTGPTGQYLITGLAGGDYEVGFQAEGFEFELYKEAFPPSPATPVHVTAPLKTEAINAAMIPAAVAPHLEREVFPIVIGTIAVGSTLSCTQGSWGGTAPLTFGYQWDRDELPIEGATGTTYTIQPSDVGHFIACTVTATNGRGSSWARSVGYRVPVPRAVPPAATAPITAPTPAGGVKGTTIVVPSLAVSGPLHVTGAKGSVRLRCALGPCRATLQLVATVARHVTVHGHKVLRHVTLVLGSGSVSLAQSASGKVTVHLNALGRRLLAGAHRPRSAKLKLALQGAGTVTRAVTVD